MVALSTSQRTISLNEHQKWLESMLISKENLLLIIASATEQKQLGYARLDCQSAEIATITIVLLPEFQGMGFGIRLISEVCKLGSARWNKLRQILAIIRKENERSLTAFSKAGFVEADTKWQQPDHFVMCLQTR